jgi:hypothetical protein
MMRRFTVPLGFTLVAMWIVTLVILVDSAHKVTRH